MACTLRRFSLTLYSVLEPMNSDLHELTAPEGATCLVAFVVSQHWHHCKARQKIKPNPCVIPSQVTHGTSNSSSSGDTG